MTDCLLQSFIHSDLLCCIVKAYLSSLHHLLNIVVQQLLLNSVNLTHQHLLLTEMNNFKIFSCVKRFYVY